MRKIYPIFLSLLLIACSETTELNGESGLEEDHTTEDTTSTYDYVVDLYIAGTLSANIPNAEISSIKITGDLNGSDIKFLRGIIESLDLIDLKDANIVSGGDAYYNITHKTSNNTIGEYMFYDLSGDFELILPYSATSIADYAFLECAGLNKVEIGGNISSIGVEAFRECINITEIEIPSLVTEIAERTFYECSSLADVVLPNNLKKISTSAFYNCENIITFNFPSNLEEIGSYAFRECGSLRSVELPNSLSELGGYAFFGCTNLSNIVLSDKMEVLETSILRNTAISSVIIPDNVIELEDYVFLDCDQLTNIVLSKNLQSFGDLSFGRNSNLQVDLNDNEYLSIDDDDILYSKDGEQLIISCRKITPSKFTVKEGVKHILDGLRNICSDTISLPQTLQKVDHFAFSHLGSDPKVMICNSIYPPDIDTIITISIGYYQSYNAFDDLEVDKIFVPQGSLYDYRFWSYYTNELLEIE